LAAGTTCFERVEEAALLCYTVSMPTEAHHSPHNAYVINHYIVRLFKGITSYRLKKEFEILRRQYWGKHATLWAEGYYVGTAGHVSAETIQHYIEASQKKTFQTPRV
jgi:hypothetical protein